MDKLKPLQSAVSKDGLWNKEVSRFVAGMLKEDVFVQFCKLILEGDDETGSCCEIVQDFLNEREQSSQTRPLETMLCSKIPRIRRRFLLAGLCHPCPEMRKLVLSEMKQFRVPPNPFADGTVADYRSSDTENRTGDAFWAFRLPQLKTRVADLVFVLDEIARRSGEAGSLWANIATDDVGVFGHSFGGATALMLAAQDDRVAKSMALDGWMVPVPPEVITAGTPKPFYYLGQAAWDDPINYKKLDKFLSASPQGKKQLEAGTKHFDYSDAPQFSNLAKRFGLSGEVSRPALRALINDAVMSFFIDDVSRAQASEANLDQ